MSGVAKTASNLVGEVSGANAAARAAQGAATAQAGTAAATRAEILKQGRDNQTAALKLAEATPRELAALDQSFDSAARNLEREERQLAAIDPAILEASSQVLKLLRGENSGVTSAVNAQRSQQRNELIASLRAQYGPGAENTSIGRRAIENFDRQANAEMAQGNQSALGTLMGISTADVGARLRSGQGALMTAGQGFGALQDRKLTAQMNTGNSLLSALSGTQASMINAAGAPYVGDSVRATAQQGLFNTALNWGMGQLGSAAFTKDEKKTS